MGEHRGREASSHLARRNFAPGGAAASGAGGGSTSPMALGGRCPGAGSASPPAGPAWQRGSLASHPGFGACELVAGHHLYLPPPSLFSLFVLLKHASCYLVLGSAIYKPASLFYKYFSSLFFSPGMGCQIGTRMNAAGRERGAAEPGTEHVSRGVGLGRAV